MVKLYPEVTFILLHVGQGDRRATNSALDLAGRYANVALEISALGRPMVIDETGTMVMTMEPQFPYVLAEIKKRGFVARALWGSDGPQTPGYPAQYLDRIELSLYLRNADGAVANYRAVTAVPFDAAAERAAS